jgi:hypothetical protein
MSAQRDRFDIGCNILGIHAGDQSCQQQGKTPLQGKRRHGYGKGVAEGNVMDWHSDHTQESTLAPEMCRRGARVDCRCGGGLWMSWSISLVGLESEVALQSRELGGTRQAWRFKPHHQWKWRRVLKISMHTIHLLSATPAHWHHFITAFRGNHHNVILAPRVA